MNNVASLAYESAAPVSGRPGLGGFTRYALLVPLCVLGILVANAYSLMITNNGLLVSNIFPDLRVLDDAIPQTRATFVFAFVLQFGIMVLYLVLAAGRPLQRLVALPFLVTLVSVSFYFGFLSVHANSRGDAYVASLNKRVDNLTAAVLGEERFMAASVNQALQGQLDLAEASRRGRDKTGVAACGPLCQGHFERAELIRARYGHLLAVAAEPPAADDIRVQWREAAAQYADYGNRAQDYDRFLKERDPAQGYVIAPALAEVHGSLQQIFGKGLDDRWMLTAHSLKDILKDASVAVSALISIMPDVINLSLSLTIGTLLQLGRRRAVVIAGSSRSGPPAALRREPSMGSLPAPVVDAIGVPNPERGAEAQAAGR